MLPRIFTGTILSIGCILTVQAAEVAFDMAIAELDMALAAPVEAEHDDSRAVSDCDVPNRPPCGEETQFAGERLAEVGAYLDCRRARSVVARHGSSTA